MNKHTIQFPRYEEGYIDVKTVKYDTENQPKKATFKYEQEGRFFLGVATIESKNRAIIGKRCPVSDYPGGNIVTIDAYNKKHRRNLQEFESIFHHCHNRSKKKTDRVWLYAYVGKLKGVGQQEKAKMNELSINTIADLQPHINHHGIPKVPI